MTRSAKKCVLVVDDEEVIRSFLAEVLGEEYEVTLACDGDEAIDLIRRNRYDVVITDLKMPRVPGEEVVKLSKRCGFPIAPKTTADSN
ncbi:MAG: response regulator [Candidatus Zixiibacteriota bacterium]